MATTPTTECLRQGPAHNPRIFQMPNPPLSSASPTPSSSSSFSSYSKHLNVRSPKKRKLNNLQSFSSTSPILSSDLQLDAARRAASSRVLNVWASLEQKYARRLDEDDIVDLRSVSIIKDRGVLSSSKGIFDFGCFELDTKIDDVENEGTENEGEDEFGGWASDLELQQQFSQVCQPARKKFDPANAEDLEEFFAAEESRKRNYSIGSSGRERDGSGEGEGEEEEEGEEGEGDEDEDASIPNTAIDLVYPSDESEDELAGYDASVGEGAMLWEVERPPEPQVSSSKPLIITKVKSQTSTCPQHSKSRSPSTPPTSPRLPPLKTSIGSTTLTPLTQRLSIQSKQPRATSVSPTKRLIPEVLLPKIKSPAFESSKSEQTSTTSSHKSIPSQRLQPANGPQTVQHRNKETVSKQTSNTSSPKSTPLQKLQPAKKPEAINKETVSNNLSPEHPTDNNSRKTVRFSPSTSMKDQVQTPHLTAPPQEEDKPQLPPAQPPAQPPAPQSIPNLPYVYPFMPSYPPHLPDWSATYQQNPVQTPPVYPTDPRIYVAQIMQALGFLLNPPGVSNPPSQ